MRLVFMGTPQFSLPPLQALVESKHEVALVVTRPDKPAGRGKQMRQPPVKQYALEQGIPVEQPKTWKNNPELLERVRALEPDVAVVVAYGRILPQEVLEIPRHGCLNIHASLLPAYRGAAPINWAIIQGERETGITIMQMDAGMDTGDIISQATVEILEDDDALSLGNMLSVMGAKRILETLDELEAKGSLHKTPQNHDLANYAPILKKDDGKLDWQDGIESIICRVRGLFPWPGAWTLRHGEPFKINKVERLWETALEKIKKPEELEPGTVALLLKGDGFAVKTGDDFLLVREAQPAGKKALPGRDLVNGKIVEEGMRLGL